MIIIAEPVCCSYEHASVNAAFIVALSNTYSNDEILFIGQEAHIEKVMSALPNNLQLKIRYQSIKIPPSSTSQRKRAIADIININSVLSIARSLKVKKILFSSISSSGILLLNLIVSFNSKIRPIVVLHRTLESITYRPSLQPWRFLFWYGFIFRVAYNKRVNYLVLGDSIKENLIRYMPKLKSQIISIDIPYLFNQAIIKSKGRSQSIKFAAIGSGSNKNTHIYFQMAKEIVEKETILKPEFYLIGQIVDPKLSAMLSICPVKVPSKDSAMSMERYQEVLNSIDYAVFLFNSDALRLCGSAALFDAFAALKPIIATKNDYFQYYFNKMGNIGFLCNDIKQVKSRILALLNKTIPDEYESQSENIFINRASIDTIHNKGLSKLWDQHRDVIK